MSKSMKLAGAVMIAAAVVASSAVQAREAQTQGTQAPRATETPVPLKVTVTISRFDGEKKTSSLPYVLWVNTGREGSSIRMGSDVAVPTTAFKEGAAIQTFTYRTLGTNIDCSASAVGDGLYRVELSVEDTQVARAAANQPGPSFQKFNARHQPILRDGQSVQFSVATDKTTGEVVKLDVMLNLVK